MVGEPPQRVADGACLAAVQFLPECCGAVNDDEFVDDGWLAESTSPSPQGHGWCDESVDVMLRGRDHGRAPCWLCRHLTAAGNGRQGSSTD
jgi:hypothetical protein